MGCRTRVMGNRHGAETSIGRGNLSFSTVNLPGIALNTRDVPAFYRLLDDVIETTIEQLYDRYVYQTSMWQKSSVFYIHKEYGGTARR